MIRQTLTLAALAASFAWAQQPAATPASGAAPASGQSHSGILMDASCAPIMSSSVSSYAAPGAAPSATAAATTPTDTATAAGTATPGTGVSQAGTTTAANQPGTTDSLAQTRVTDRANQTQLPRSTAQEAERNDPATGIAGRGTGAGTSAAGHPPLAGNPPVDATGPQSTVASSGTTPGAVAEGTRARTELPAGVDSKYKDCKVNANTSKFAIYSNGAVTMLDEASNTMVKDKLRNNSKVSNSEWLNVNLQGTVEGGNLKVSSFDPGK